MPVRVEEIADLDGLRRLRPSWDALWRRVPDATPFSSAAWLLPWCEELGDAAPWAIACWRGRELAAFAPTFVYPGQGGRVLGLLGGGVSDYQDALAEDAAAARAIVEHLARRGDRFDVADLQSLPGSSKLLGATSASGLRHRVAPQEAGAVLPLPPRFDDLSPRMSRSLLHDVRYQRRRLAREGGLAVTRVRSREELDGALEDLFRLHAAQWRVRGEEGLLASASVQRFHRAASRELLGAGLLRLLTLRVGGVPIAVSYGMSAHARAYAYLFGIDPAEACRSAGSLVIAHAIEDAIAEGAGELDFLRGDERYKARWGAIVHRTVRLGFVPSGPGTRAGVERLPACEQDDGMRAGPPWSS